MLLLFVACLQWTFFTFGVFFFIFARQKKKIINFFISCWCCRLCHFGRCAKTITTKNTFYLKIIYFSFLYCLWRTLFFKCHMINEPERQICVVLICEQRWNVAFVFCTEISNERVTSFAPINFVCCCLCFGVSWSNWMISLNLYFPLFFSCFFQTNFNVINVTTRFMQLCYLRILSLKCFAVAFLISFRSMDFLAIDHTKSVQQNVTIWEVI